MKPQYVKAIFIFLFVASVFMMITFRQTLTEKPVVQQVMISNKEAAKSLNQESAAVVLPQPALPLIDSSATAKNSGLSTEDADLCTVAQTEASKISPVKTVETIFKTANKFRDDHSSAKTAEYIIKNILQSGAIDPDAPVDTHDVIEFYRALVYGGLINPKDYDRFINYKKAEEILASLEVKHPENGAFPLFKAGVLHNAGTADAQLKSLYTKGMPATGFNTFHSEIWVPVLQRSFSSPELYLRTQRMMSTSRIIDYTTTFRPLFRLIDTDTELAQLAVDFAAKLYPKNIPEKGRFEFYEWFALDFAISERLRHKALKILNPNTKIEPAKRLSDILTWHSDPDFRSLSQPNENGSPACDSIKLKALIAREENIYTNYLRTKNEPAN